MEALTLLQSGESFKSVSKHMHICDGDLKTWSLIYEKEGEKSLAVYPKNVCTGAIKDKIICTYQRKRVPLHVLSAKYHVPYSSVARCIQTYRRKGNAGVEGAVISWDDLLRPGDSMEENLSKAELKNRLKVALNENEYLRAEVAYLKKLKALMEADEKRKRNGSKPSSQ